MHNQLIFLVQIILGIILVILVLLQSKGAGIGSTFGGDMGFYGTKRGAEKLLFYLTIIIAGAFLTMSLIGIVFNH
ncbi:preprotein translocase subunit SecG [Candidatus Daviesbacteria bacterium]|nr:preprotein translocase subunit SecG [Candidatus Daviesbacteria bacterium]